MCIPYSDYLSPRPLLNPSAGPYCDVQDKAYGRAALVAGEEDTEDVMRRFRVVQEKVGEILEGVDAKPALLHGDLWIGEFSHASHPPPPLLRRKTMNHSLRGP